MKKVIEFIFFRWKSEVIKQGRETWIQRSYIGQEGGSEYSRSYVDYRMTNKFDGSVKIKRKYLN